MIRQKTLKGLGLALLLGLASCGGEGASSSSSKTEIPDPTDDPAASYPTYEEASVRFHYNRADGSYQNWALWLWTDDLEGQEYAFNGTDSYGAVASYPLSTWDMTGDDRIYFIVKSAGSWDAKDPDGDRYVDLATWTPSKDGAYDIYLASGDKNVYANASLTLADVITNAAFSSYTEIAVATSNPVASYSLKILEGTSAKTVEGTLERPATAFTISLGEENRASFEKTYILSCTFEESGATLEQEVNRNALYKTDEFEENYTYEGNDLGAKVLNGTTTFKVWSPTSEKIELNVYANGTPASVDPSKGSDEKKTYPMTLGEKGVYEAAVKEDLSGSYYTYTVYSTAYPEGREIVDPYAKSAGINGLRGMVVDFTKTNPEGWDEVEPLPYDRKELVIYETHVADVSSSETWGGTAANRHLYEGLIESGTFYEKDGKSVATGFDSIVGLGVNAVQLLPIFDQANDETKPSFNWGYNPLNYNVVEGVYSSDPYDGYVRIRELKEVVQAFEAKGINVIMDVVYNHTNGLVGSNFDVLAPGYYYRYNADGTAGNGTGCGNEIASEMPMMRKFIVDSTSFWAKEYKLGGFRFDLMGCLDVGCMNAVVEALKAINPNIFVHGEPWTGGTLAYDTSFGGGLADQSNMRFFKGFGAFNDGMRDALIKGGLAGAKERGWVSAAATTAVSGTDIDAIRHGLRGSTYSGGSKTNDPDKTTNYVTCHDNYTLYDRFYYGVGGYDEATVAKMSVVANAFVFLSQGTSFMLGGDELLRTKGGNSNSYESSYEVNELDYARKAAHPDVYAAYQKLIALKKGCSGLHVGADGNMSLSMAKVDQGKAEWTFEGTFDGANKRFKVAITNGNGGGKTADFAGYELYLDSLGTLTSLTAATSLDPYQVVVGVQTA